MLCAVCNKESRNLRVCPYCFTPYETDAPASKRPSLGRTPTPLGGTPAAGAPPAAEPTPITDGIAALKSGARRAWGFYRRQSPVVQLSSAGIALVLVLWAMGGDAPTVDPGSVPAEVIATPVQREQALAIIKQTRETAIVDVQQDEVFVSYPAATFPVLEEGQLALAQQFAQADALVEGRKRRIYFYNPNGKLFAQADGVSGVRVVR